MNDTMKLLATLLIVGGLVIAGVYFVRSKRQEEPQSYVKSEVIKEQKTETIIIPEPTPERTEEQVEEQTVVDIK